MPVHKRGRKIPAFSVDDTGILADRRRHVTYGCNSPHRHGYAVIIEYFVRTDVDQFNVRYNKVRLFSSERNRRKFTGTFPERKFTKCIYHICLLAGSLFAIPDYLSKLKSPTKKTSSDRFLFAQPTQTLFTVIVFAGIMRMNFVLENAASTSSYSSPTRHKSPAK